MSRRHILSSQLFLALVASTASTALAVDNADRLDLTTLPPEQRAGGREALSQHLQHFLRSYGSTHKPAWESVRNRADWAAFVEPRIDRLRASLNWPAGPRQPPAVKTDEPVKGDGWTCVPLVYESRPGLWVTANLYRPTQAAGPMPCIVISHSHHNPKTETELRQMGCGWAKAGCLVLVPDHLGHGQRRAHPFHTAADWPKPYRVGRQDYYFRYMSSLQLYAAGESLMGWMAWDLSRGVDVLLSQQGADANRVAVLGAVAGGGDPAAVVAALDPRIAAAAPFNFGGPQPETKYPLPENAEETFNYTGGGSWESTRNLHRSAVDGFLPWVIVGSIAPRVLVYGHEFSWDRPRDPVWKRFEIIWQQTGAGDRLGFAHGRGALSGKAPEATHCNNIGPVHLAGVAEWLDKTLKIPLPAKVNDLPAADAVRVSPGLAANVRPLHEVLSLLAAERSARVARSAEGEPPARTLARWHQVLGDRPHVEGNRHGPFAERTEGDLQISQVVPESDGLPIPITLLRRAGGDHGRRPTVLMFAQQGKQRLYDARKTEIAELLNAGCVVAMVDLRGCGETSPGTGRGRGSEATSLSASALMLGDPLLAQRLRDVRVALSALKLRLWVDPKRIALWGDSLAVANPADTKTVVPLDLDQPASAEPNAALIAWLAAGDGVLAVYTRGGLNAYQDLYAGPSVHLPHDAIVPGAVWAGDLPLLRKAVAGIVPTRNDALVDATNRLTSQEQPTETPVAWLVKSLRADRR
jgi:cephalosporin-C deacetylase-like acetyl esterase